MDLADRRLFGGGAAVALLALALLGSPVEAALHVALAIGALLVAFLPEARARRGAVALATILLALAVLGIFSPGLLGYGRWLGLRFEISENIGHALVGAWAAYVASNG